MQLLPADGLLPGGAAVSAHSDYESVATATRIAWEATDGAAHPSGSGRLTVDLGGRWERAADESAPTSFPVPGARAAAGLPDTLAWRKVVVPDNFGSDDEFSAFFGPMWYRRRFADPWADLGDGPAGHVRLRFRAVDYLADVWLNGEHLGHHEGAFAPFGFEVTDRLVRDNEVVVCVQDPLEPLDPAAFFFAHRKRVIKGTLKYHDSRPGGLPGRMAGPLVEGGDPWVWTPEWGQSMTTAGITDAVELVRTGACLLDAVFVTPLEQGTSVQVAAIVTNHTGGPRDAVLHLEIEGDAAAAAVTLPPGAGRVDLRVDLVGLGRWEPAHSPRGAPELHQLRATLVVADRVTDRRTVRFGLRTARVVTDVEDRPTHLEVNGHPVFVKAVNYIPWQHFADVGRSFYDRDMRMITEAHGNSIGVHAHVQSPHAYDAADAAGVLVFQDFPLQWFYDSGTETNPGFVDTASRQIAEMAYVLHHHPSVVYYACHNEPRRMFIPVPEADDGPARDLGERHLDAALLRTLRGVDSSRHVHEASGIGADVHDYQGSLMGGSLYRVGESPAWFVSEYGFWTIGPQFERFGDPPTWPPDEPLLREWVSRLSFIGSTVSFVGRPERYASLREWAEATEAYGAALAKYQTEWFRAHRGAPFMGYRWHFWSDWWGYAGGGLVDVERVPKRTYAAFRDASRPLLAIGLVDRSVVDAGPTAVRVVAVNDRDDPIELTVDWALHEARGAVIAPDPDGMRIGFPMPPDGDSLVAIERDRSGLVDEGRLVSSVAAEATAGLGTVTVRLAPGDARTLVLRWTDPRLGIQENSVHLACPVEGVVFAPRALGAGVSEALRNDAVDVACSDDGTWQATWSGPGIVLASGGARIDLTTRDLTNRSAAGSWQLRGAVARWEPADDGPWLELELRDDVITVQMGYRATADEVVGLLTPIVAIAELEAVSRLVDGYDSWAYSGVVAGERHGDSWWNSALVDRSGRALAVQALGSDRFATRIVVVDEMLIVECGGTPPMRFVPDTWGYEVLEPLPLALPLPAGAEVRSERIAVTAGTDAVALVDRLAARAAAIGGARRWTGDPIAGWESWYHYGFEIDADTLLTNARILRDRIRGHAGFDVVQLDDGWQVAHGAWTPNDGFPADLGELTAALRSVGARPGLWLAPFMVTPGAPGLGTEHADWCLTHNSGHTLLDRHGKWALDASHPDALTWLERLGEQVRAWGFHMVKLDFLYLGGQEAIRHDPTVTGTEALRNGLRAFVTGLGDDVYVLGCGMPMLPALGICHGNRVGPDLATPVLHRRLGPQPLTHGWSGWHGIEVQARNVAARFALRHWFDCDPDVVLAWSAAGDPDGYTLEEAHTLATVAALSGGPFFLADDLAALDPAARAVLEDPVTLDLVDGDGFVPVDLFTSPERPAVEHAFAPATGIASEWVAERDGRPVTARFNWTDDPIDDIPDHGVRVDLGRRPG